MTSKSEAPVEQSYRVFQDLIGLMLAGSNLDQLVRAVSERVNRPVSILDAGGRCLAGCGPEAQELSSRARKVLNEKRGRPVRSRTPAAQVLAELDLVLVPVAVAGRVRGHVAAPLQGRSLMPLAQQTLQHAAAAAGVHFLQQQAAKKTEMRLRDDFVWSLATGNMQSEEYAATRGRLLGYDLTRPYVGICGQMEGMEEAGPETIQTAAQRVLTAARRAAGEMRRRIMSTFVENSLVIFLEAEDPERIAGKFIRRLMDRVRSERMGRQKLVISWGVGEVHPGLANFKQTYSEARQACQIGRRLKEAGHVTFVGEAGIYRTLLKFARDPDARQLCERLITPLLEYEKSRGMEILRTLEVYLETQGNVSETARRLHLHRGSLLYRLERVEQLTGCNLSNAQDRFNLELSLQLHQICDLEEAAG